MSTLAHTLIEAGLRHRLVTARILAGLLGPGEARRYGLVNRALEDRQTALIASPLRALMDLVALRRCEWQGLLQEVAHQDLASNFFALKIHALLCRGFLKGRGCRAVLRQRQKP